MKTTRIKWEPRKRANEYEFNPEDWKQEAAFTYHLNKKGWKVEKYTDGGYGGVWFDKEDIFSLQDETQSKPLAEFIDSGTKIISLGKDKRLESFLKEYNFKRGLASVKIRYLDMYHHQIWSKNSPAPQDPLYY